MKTFRAFRSQWFVESELVWILLCFGIALHFVKRQEAINHPLYFFFRADIDFWSILYTATGILGYLALYRQKMLWWQIFCSFAAAEFFLVSAASFISGTLTGVAVYGWLMWFSLFRGRTMPYERRMLGRKQAAEREARKQLRKG